MSRIVADGTLELQDLSAGYWFEIERGGLDGVPLVRGENITIPGKAGQTWAPKVAHEWPLVLHGIVHGASTDSEESYLTRMQALLAIFDATADPFTIAVHPDATGVGGRLGSGETATITVEFLRLVGGPARGDQFRVFDLECASITDPPGWTISEGS